MPSGFFHLSTITGDKPPSRIPHCGACGLYRTCNSPKMPVSGKGERKILIVGEAPGEKEDQKNKQFVGKTGQLLENTLLKHGIEMRKDCWLTNANICRPPKNRKPTDKEIAYCRPNVINTILELKPEIVIPLGGVAVQSVLSWLWKDKVDEIGRWIGWKIPCQKINAWVCPAWHPSFVARQDSNGKKKNPEVEIIWDQHLSAISDLSGRPWKKVPDFKKQVEVILDKGDAERAIKWAIERGGSAAFDFENNCLKPDWDDAEIVSASICSNGERTFAFPWHGEKVIQAFIEFLVSPIRKIASNLKHEDRWCRRKLKTLVRNWAYDTMQGAHVRDCRRKITSIKFQAFVHLGQEVYNTAIEPFLTTHGTAKINRILKEIEIRQLLLYNGLDSLLEYKVAAIEAPHFGVKI